jgi:peptidoglycan/xylan/chitin deacetylase (PgdA/CDA1 family)
MPWKDRYTISDEQSLTDDQVVWADGKACCVTIVVDLSPLCGPAGLSKVSLCTPEAHYNRNGGLSALRALFKRTGLRATFAVPAVLAGVMSDTLRALQDEGHEIAAHGYLREDVSLLDASEEARRLVLTTRELEHATGKRPSGWFSLPRQGDKFAGGAISNHTAGLLLDAGYDYLGNSLADDIPHYWVSDFATARCILALPYYYHFDDQFFLMFPAKGTGLEHPDVLSRNWQAELAAQYKRGRQFSMVLHPHAIAWPNRMLVLEQFIDVLQGYPRLWNPTSAECAAYWSGRYPASQFLRLEPSIWQDYPGSLS